MGLSAILTGTNLITLTMTTSNIIISISSSVVVIDVKNIDIFRSKFLESHVNLNE